MNLEKWTVFLQKEVNYITISIICKYSSCCTGQITSRTATAAGTMTNSLPAAA